MLILAHSLMLIRDFLNSFLDLGYAVQASLKILTEVLLLALEKLKAPATILTLDVITQAS